MLKKPAGRRQQLKAGENKRSRNSEKDAGSSSNNKEHTERFATKICSITFHLTQTQELQVEQSRKRGFRRGLSVGCRLGPGSKRSSAGRRKKERV